MKDRCYLWFFCIFEVDDINEISEIGGLNDFLLLCGTDQAQSFEVQDLPIAGATYKIFFGSFRKFIN